MVKQTKVEYLERPRTPDDIIALLPNKELIRQAELAKALNCYFYDVARLVRFQRNNKEGKTRLFSRRERIEIAIRKTAIYCPHCGTCYLDLTKRKINKTCGAYRCMVKELKESQQNRCRSCNCPLSDNLETHCDNCQELAGFFNSL